MLAALPAAPAAPLSQKSRFAAIFGSPVCFSGHTYYKTRAAFTFPAGALSRKLGALAQKCDFACASILAHTIL
ncbi:MAG TPA: hypothetical protein H9851_03040, partial [Candidatus Borkfalkia faecavium]|nr:hypothetical protein [Candidatus Borkfalkia faecavium]